MPGKKVQERVRDIRLWWERDPDGPVLQRDRAPVGLRTPNGFVWGHKVDHIFWIQRIPGAHALTVWSRSMIKEHGEGYDDTEWDEPLVEPRVVRPWPVLCLLGRDGKSRPILLPDRGCAIEHLKKIAPPEGWVRAPESDVMSPAMLALLGECPHDPEEMCTGPMLSNAGPERLKNDEGEYYDYLWCEHFREIITSVDEPHRFFTHAVAVTGHVHLVPDTTGLCMYVPPRGDKDPSKLASEVSASAEHGNDANRGATDSAPVAPGTSDADVVMTDSIGPSVDDQPAGDDSSPTTEVPKVDAQPSTDSRNPYCVTDLPKLQEMIPEQLFPDILMVHDPHHTTRSWLSPNPGEDPPPIKYKRVYPDPKGKADAEDEPRSENVAHLHLSSMNRFGAGNHSYVYRAPLTLPPPLSAQSPTGQVTVAAKLAYNRCTAHGLLHNEARVYDSLPNHVQEDWCGYNVVPQCRFPVPASAIVPKFYGYYLPVDEKGQVRKTQHTSCSEDHPCKVEWPSPILLMEECGKPVEPAKFTADQRYVRSPTSRLASARSPSDRSSLLQDGVLLAHLAPAPHGHRPGLVLRTQHHDPARAAVRARGGAVVRHAELPHHRLWAGPVLGVGQEQGGRGQAALRVRAPDRGRGRACAQRAARPGPWVLTE
ncbi:hypothetical protein C8Q80DRAFT_1147148 [Daedaleopsis nitida]|nr:hypothetical protein C8Q80DRAFT_1147148 [Daedaleopsis nitida]